MNNVYTHGHHESVLRSHSWRTAENSAGYLLPQLRPGRSLLDIGAGPGTITADLAALVQPGRTTALEANEAALDITRATFAKLDIEVDFVVGDVHRLELPDDSYDVVHAHQVLQHVGDPVQALKEMRRVCKPGGIVAARDSDYHAFTWFPELPELDEWMDLYQRMARANGGEPDAGRRLLAWALAAGFERVETTASNWTFANQPDRDWWGGMWADRILQSDLARQARAAGVPEGDLQRISDAWRTWSAAPDGFISLLHGEILATA
ncbi:ubiquinone/menaquinone biosynthesis C-methylase UbiE [Kribbella orskensis]|uniref:Ubiquinone/menaquinone biosynthesis C-methylase UbiE n=1 Tax=Kribbella orskensis TaxID=2512216 RepID=A0ABY2BKJ1_9ACTN|nr:MULTISPECIES: class I SAM-dependent methyltransferase [Kribbella]TCN40518.1 ubiquinone/menaquinone biosynthesis C-methylase UbiE [Kribbella sp. VKM Ac-2500]TCO23138.1 ubiquinone/menaquinone biosynthesis C-methylase UbiE [Kribbella orskensis]